MRKVESCEVTVYAIYEHPADAPDHFVTRCWVNRDGDSIPGEAWYEETYEKALTHVPPGLVKFLPFPQDPPQLKEVWM